MITTTCQITKKTTIMMHIKKMSINQRRVMVITRIRVENVIPTRAVRKDTHISHIKAMIRITPEIATRAKTNMNTLRNITKRSTTTTTQPISPTNRRTHKNRNTTIRSRRPRP